MKKIRRFGVSLGILFVLLPLLTGCGGGATVAAGRRRSRARSRCRARGRSIR